MVTHAFYGLLSLPGPLSPRVVTVLVVDRSGLLVLQEEEDKLNRSHHEHSRKWLPSLLKGVEAVQDTYINCNLRDAESYPG